MLGRGPFMCATSTVITADGLVIEWQRDTVSLCVHREVSYVLTAETGVDDGSDRYLTVVGGHEID